jgi:hypothetical protein
MRKRARLVPRLIQILSQNYDGNNLNRTQQSIAGNYCQAK